MGFREALNRSRNATSLAAVVLIAAAAVAIFYETTRGHRPGKLTQAFYSDDDGQSYFEDDVDKLVPFDHNGKTAYLAYVFKCSDGKQFVGYILRYNERTTQKLKELLTRPGTSAATEIVDAKAEGTEIKKPGAPNWVPMNAKNADKDNDILDVKCPDGGAVVGVSP